MAAICLGLNVLKPLITYANGGLWFVLLFVCICLLTGFYKTNVDEIFGIGRKWYMH